MRPGRAAPTGECWALVAATGFVAFCYRERLAPHHQHSTYGVFLLGRGNCSPRVGNGHTTTTATTTDGQHHHHHQADQREG